MHMLQNMRMALFVRWNAGIFWTARRMQHLSLDIMQRQKTDVSGNKLISSFMASVEKTGKKCVKAIVKRKKTVPLGIDGKFMCFFGRLFPNFTASVIAGVLKSSKQELFSDVFDYKS